MFIEIDSHGFWNIGCTIYLPTICDIQPAADIKTLLTTYMFHYQRTTHPQIQLLFLILVYDLI